MNSIIICGNRNDISVTNIVKKAVSLYINPTDDNSKFIFKECDNVSKIEKEDKGVVVFKNSFNYNNEPIYLKNMIPIFDSQNYEARKVLKKQGNIAISCGMSLHDTLSISSLDFSSAIVSLQRQIINFNLKVIEPYEFRVNFSEKSGIYPILASCAILLLLGISPKNKYDFNQ